MAALYETLTDLGFVNTTPPTPDEWDHPDGLQVRIRHVAGICEIRYRQTPPGSESHGIDKQLEHDRSYPWNVMSRDYGPTVTSFNVWLVGAGGTIATQLRAIGLVA